MIEATNGRLLIGRDGQALADGFAMEFFDTMDQCDAAFGEIVGDDGPTPKNSYDGPVRCFAMTCSPTGEVMNENT